MAINQPVQRVLDKFTELLNTANSSLTIANVYHMNKFNDSCICDICTLSHSVRVSDIEKYCIHEIILSCQHFSYDDPLEFIMWELKSSQLTKLNTFNQFMDRTNLISKKINSEKLNKLKCHIPKALRTDIILNEIFDFVGGDYFLSLWNTPNNGESQIKNPLIFDIGEQTETEDSSVTVIDNSVDCIALVDYFGNKICRLSPQFRSSFWNCIYIDAQTGKSPNIFALIGDKLLRWVSDDNNMLNLDSAFHTKSEFANVCASRYWNYSGLERGICLYASYIWIASEEYIHVSNRESEEISSSENVSNLSVTQLGTVSGDCINKYKINFATPDSLLLSDCDFNVVSSKWLLSDNRDTTFCFALFQRKHKMIQFIDPSQGHISRKINLKIKKSETNISEQMRIIFIDYNHAPMMIAYSIPNEDTYTVGFRDFELTVLTIDIYGNTVKNINLPLGDWIQFVSVSERFIYVDVMAGQFGVSTQETNSDRHTQIISDNDDDFIGTQIMSEMEWEQQLELACVDSSLSKPKWFSSSTWRYILDIHSLDIIALFSVKHGDTRSKLFKHVNPTIFNF